MHSINRACRPIGGALSAHFRREGAVQLTYGSCFDPVLKGRRIVTVRW